MQRDAYAVIMSGGRGERFWPLSTAKKPKQLMSLFGGRPLIAAAVDRLRGLVPRENVLIVTSRELVQPTREAMPDFPPEQVIGEPARRDTAAAIALGAVLVGARHPEAAFCVLTADHVIRDETRFRLALGECLRWAGQGDYLLTMGIAPSYPSTGFGYIEAGERLSGDADPIPVHAAVRFVEKPDAETAESYVRSGRFSWNSGMFAWTVESIRRAFVRHRPELDRMCEVLLPAARAGRLEEAAHAVYERLERISIDYAVMEKARNVLVVRGDFGWDDVGVWTSVERHFPADAAGNVAVGACAAVDSARNIVVGERDELIALLGVDDLVVVRAGKATLVCRRDRAQDVKKIVQRLEAEGDHANIL